MKQLTDQITFPCGITMKNRFMLAPLTNTQSHQDGTLSEEELNWLTMRAKGGFGMVMTCASHVQAIGKGFPGQLGIFDDRHIEGHSRLATDIKKYGSLAVIQLHHAGMRSDKKYIDGAPVAPSPIERKGARRLNLAEIATLKDDFIKAAIRAKTCGYDGVEIHGAHGYIISQFLSSEINQRTDHYGGSLENRARLLFEIMDGVRKACGDNFLLGVRLSPERFGMKLSEIKAVCQRLIQEGQTDFIDLSLWDCFKYPEETDHQEKSLLEYYTEIDFKNVVLSVAGNIRTGKQVRDILQTKVNAVSIGRAAILHHDFPKKVMNDEQFEPVTLPVSPAYLQSEGLSEIFIDYMRNWKGFVVSNPSTIKP